MFIDWVMFRINAAFDLLKSVFYLFKRTYMRIFIVFFVLFNSFLIGLIINLSLEVNEMKFNHDAQIIDDLEKEMMKIKIELEKSGDYYD